MGSQQILSFVVEWARPWEGEKPILDSQEKKQPIFIVAYTSDIPMMYSPVRVYLRSVMAK